MGQGNSQDRNKDYKDRNLKDKKERFLDLKTGNRNYRKMDNYGKNDIRSNNGRGSYNKYH